jgi:hypothetical protein
MFPKVTVEVHLHRHMFSVRKLIGEVFKTTLSERASASRKHRLTSEIRNRCESSYLAIWATAARSLISPTPAGMLPSLL